MHKLTTDRMKWGGSALLAAVLLSLVCGVWVSRRSVRPKVVGRDCAKRSPLEAFGTVFGFSPPPGVSDVSAAGRIWPDRWSVFLRFRATDDAIGRLTKGNMPAGARQILANIETERKEDRLLGKSHLKWREEGPGWDEVKRIRKPECYFLLRQAHASTPSLGVIVDRARHLVYVYSFNW
jgi:hypothetical protein